MDVTSTKSDDRTVVSVAGRVDAVTAPDLEKRLFDLIDDGATHLILDFARMDYISSAGLRVVLSTAKKLKPVNGSVCLAGLSGAVREVFEISGFFSIFKAFDTVADAGKQG